MLNRRLIIEHAGLVKYALSVRYPPYAVNLPKSLEDLFETVDQVALLGQQSFDLDKQIKDARRDRNLIADKFPKASKEEKIVLKQDAADLKTKISELEKLYEIVEKECREYEAHIPNVPDPGIPLWSNISDDNREFYQGVLRVVHHLIEDYNHLIISDEISGYTKHVDDSGIYYAKNE
jgi:seryl-tRNA synthetase